MLLYGEWQVGALMIVIFFPNSAWISDGMVCGDVSLKMWEMCCKDAKHLLILLSKAVKTANGMQQKTANRCLNRT